MEEGEEEEESRSSRGPLMTMKNVTAGLMDCVKRMLMHVTWMKNVMPVGKIFLGTNDLSFWNRSFDLLGAPLRRLDLAVA